MPDATLRAQPLACRSTTCRSLMVAAPSPAPAHSARPRRHAFLVVFDCDDETALARLREIAPCTIALEPDDQHLQPASALPADAPEDELTARQKDILAGVMRGLSNKEIGRELGISHFTVRNHVSRLLQHLAMPSRRQLRRVLAAQDGASSYPAAMPEPRHGSRPPSISHIHVSV